MSEAGSLRQDVIEFVRKASIEITPNDEKHLDDFGRTLAPGTVMYVAHTPKASLHDVVRAACRAQESGFRGCAHIVARRLASEADLRAALYRLREAGCDRVLFIAGDVEEPAGPYASTLDILKTDVAAECGIRILGIAGHPEGNPNIPEDEAWKALAAKHEYAARTGTEVYVVTQFGFDAARILEFGRHLRRRGIRLPVHVGLAGPAPLDKLIRYAVLCGIGASIKAALTKDGLVAKLTKAARSVDQVVLALIKESTLPDRATLLQPHFFPFGGSVATANWIRAISDGRFDIDAGATGLTMRD